MAIVPSLVNLGVPQEDAQAAAEAGVAVVGAILGRVLEYGESTELVPGGVVYLFARSPVVQVLEGVDLGSVAQLDAGLSAVCVDTDTVVRYVGGYVVPYNGDEVVPEGAMLMPSDLVYVSLRMARLIHAIDRERLDLYRSREMATEVVTIGEVWETSREYAKIVDRYRRVG